MIISIPQTNFGRYGAKIGLLIVLILVVLFSAHMRIISAFTASLISIFYFFVISLLPLFAYRIGYKIERDKLFRSVFLFSLAYVFIPVFAFYIAFFVHSQIQGVTQGYFLNFFYFEGFALLFVLLLTPFIALGVVITNLFFGFLGYLDASKGKKTFLKIILIPLMIVIAVWAIYSIVSLLSSNQHFEFLKGGREKQSATRTIFKSLLSGTTDISSCLNVDRSVQGTCDFIAVLVSKDESMCNLAPLEQLCTDLVREINSGSLNRATCENISAKSDCYYYVAIYLQDKTLCSKTFNPQHCIDLIDEKYISPLEITPPIKNTIDK